eukprot:567466-Rhodomonas_salina.3
MTDRGFRSNASISEIVGQIELEGVTGAVTFDTSLDRVTSQLALVNFDADEDAWRQVSQRPRGIKAESLFFRTVSIRNAIDFAAALCTDSAWGYQVAVWDARPPWVLNPLVATDLRRSVLLPDTWARGATTVLTLGDGATSGKEWRSAAITWPNASPNVPSDTCPCRFWITGGTDDHTVLCKVRNQWQRSSSPIQLVPG